MAVSSLSPVSIHTLMPARSRLATVSGTPVWSLSSIAVPPVCSQHAHATQPTVRRPGRAGPSPLRQPNEPSRDKASAPRSGACGQPSYRESSAGSPSRCRGVPAVGRGAAAPTCELRHHAWPRPNTPTATFSAIRAHAHARSEATLRTFLCRLDPVLRVLVIQLAHSVAQCPQAVARERRQVVAGHRLLSHLAGAHAVQHHVVRAWRRKCPATGRGGVCISDGPNRCPASSPTIVHHA